MNEVQKPTGLPFVYNCPSILHLQPTDWCIRAVFLYGKAAGALQDPAVVSYGTFTAGR